MFEYFYGNEPKQYAFYSIPQVLFTDEKFKKMSCESKVLYGLMLDKAGLSFKNNWLDKDGRVFVYFKRDDVCEMLGCKKDKATKILNELDENKGIGLIKRVAQGQGKPDRIYVKNFMRVFGQKEVFEGNPANSSETDNTAAEIKEHSENGLKTETAFKKAENPPSRKLKKRSLDSEKTASLPINHTKRTILSESTYPIYQRSESKTTAADQNKPDMIDSIDYQTKTKEICDRIAYGYLESQFNERKEELDELVDVIAWAELTKKPTLKVNGENMTTKLVQNRLAKINESHIEYVLDCIAEQTVKINQRRSYLLTCLFNAPVTISGYYANLVNHDLYGMEKRE